MKRKVINKYSKKKKKSIPHLETVTPFREFWFTANKLKAKAVVYPELGLGVYLKWKEKRERNGIW